MLFISNKLNKNRNEMTIHFHAKKSIYFLLIGIVLLGIFFVILKNKNDSDFDKSNDFYAGYMINKQRYVEKFSLNFVDDSKVSDQDDTYNIRQV